jgi:hypothetical protein
VVADGRHFAREAVLKTTAPFLVGKEQVGILL